MTKTNLKIKEDSDESQKNIKKLLLIIRSIINLTV